MYGIYYNRTTPILAFLEGMVRVFDWAALLELRKRRRPSQAEDDTAADTERKERDQRNDLIVSWYINDSISAFESAETAKLTNDATLYRRRSAIANAMLGPTSSQHVILRYEELVPGACDLIMGRAQQRLEQDGKHELELLRQRGRQGNMGMIAGFILAMLLTAGALLMLLSGNPWAGLAIMGINLALAVAASVYVTKAQVRDKLYTRDFFPVKKRKTQP